mgnify:CR=1 FL=1
MWISSLFKYLRKYLNNDKIVPMMLDESKIKSNQQWLLGISENIREKTDMCFVISDITRVKILFLLKRHEELCVTDFAKILNISMGVVSHQLNFLEKANLIDRTKMGQMVCYSLNKNGFEILSTLV